MGHLTLPERVLIENALRARKGFKEIARLVGHSHTTVKREVVKHARESGKGAKGRVTNRCVKRTECRRQFVCGSCLHPQSMRHCASCAKCNSACPEFEELSCERLSRPPYVCNGCTREGVCVLRKRFYVATVAQEEYERTLSESREGFALTSAERRTLAEALAPGMRRGQSVHHIVAASPDAFPVCEKSLYAYLHAGALTPLGPLDLPAAPKMRPRRRKGAVHMVDRRCLEGRRQEDFAAFCRANPDLPVVEMDSVEGTRGGKVLLTLNFDSCGLMLPFVREANTSRSVIDVFDGLERTLGLEAFRELLPVVLTDNGTEFSNPAALETSPDTGERRTRIFYCRPYSAWQKPHVENNHLNLRRIFPKGEPMDHVTPEKAALAACHLNSMLRRSFGNVPAIVRFEQAYGKGILEKLGVRLVPASEVRLTPDLVRP
ncbi:MAG: IS30 family transposase [Desulfovibrio sp.]|nr:IS30 family transposase [Desulfovibrio sp.]